MTSSEYINGIIATRGQWNDDVYYSEIGCEKHHIIPCCLGGEGDFYSKKAKKWLFRKHSHHKNCVYLYPHEHYIVYKLLFLENKDNKSLSLAFSMMAFPKGKTKRKYELTPEEYELARIATKLATTGENNPMSGKKPWCYGLTKETDARVALISKKVSKARTGVKLGPNSDEARYNKSLAQKKRAKEHPETFISHNKGKLSITNGCISYYIEKDAELPDTFYYGQTHKKEYDLTNYYSNKDMIANRKEATSGENNGMFGKGYKVAGGKNGHASIRYFYKDKVFECKNDLIDYLESIGLHITKSAIRVIVQGKGTMRVYNMYKDILDNLSWEYKA